MHRSCRSLIVAFVEDLPARYRLPLCKNAPLLYGPTYDEVEYPQSMHDREAARAGLQITQKEWKDDVQKEGSARGYGLFIFTHV